MAEAGESVRARLVSGALWLLLGSFSVSLGGLAYWLIVGRVAGLEVVGRASAAVGSAGVAVYLLSSGLGLASSRLAASKGWGSGLTILGLALPMALLVGLAAYLLSLPVEPRLSPMAGLLAASMVLANAGVGLSVGLEAFQRVFAAQLAGAVSRVALAPIVAGAGSWGVVLGYTAQPAAIALLTFSLWAVGVRGMAWPGARRILAAMGRGVGELLRLLASNYPHMVSVQLTVMMSVYLSSMMLVSREELGALYLDLMILMALYAVPASLQQAALPLGVRRGGNPVLEGARVGLAVSLPLSAALSAAAPLVLSVVNPGLAWSANALRLLLASLPAMALLQAAATAYNIERRLGRLALLGGLRLVLLLVLLPALAPMGAAYAALAIVLASSLACLAVPRSFWGARWLPVLWLLHIAFAVSPAILEPPPATGALAYTLAALAALHATRVYRVSELAATLRTAAAAVAGARGRL